MADDTNEVQHEEQEPQGGEMTAEQKLAEAERTIEALKKKSQELLGETKAEREKRREYEAKQSQIERERMEQEGQHQELAKRWQGEAEQYKSELETLRRGIANEKLSSTASKLAHEYASDAQTAKLLERFIRDELDYVDGQVVASNHASIEEMIKSMEQSGGYASLWKGKASSGGGATGQKSGGAAAKKLSDLSGTERAALASSEPETFARLVAEAKQKRG